MHSFYTRSVAAIALTALLLFGAAQAQAHALYAAHSWQGTVALVQFAYAGGQVPTYAKVEVYSPADAKVEFQNGRTDAQGRFAFMPDTPGQWRIIMADNMGHRVVHETTVAENGGAAPTADAATDAWGRFATPLRALLGVSLLLNLGTMSVLWRQRRKA